MAFQRASDAPPKNFGGVRYHRGVAITVFIISLAFITTVDTQTIGNGGTRINSVSAGQLIQVTPQCADDMIVVHVRVNPRMRSTFADWIIVGENSRPECRLRGNGELRYVVQIVLRNDPCQTKQIEPNVFENTLRIAQFPSIILQDDINFRFRCSRGIPEVMEFRLPQVNPTFDIDRNVLSGATRDLLPGLLSTPRTALNIGGDQRSIFDRQEFGDGSQLPNGLDLNRLAVADASTPSGLSLANSNSSNSFNNMLAVLLSVLLILSVLIFLLCLFACLRYCQRRRDADALMKAHAGAISTTAAAGGGGGTQTRHLLSSYGRQRQGNGSGQNSSATDSPILQNGSRSPDSSSLSHSGEDRRLRRATRHPGDNNDHATTWWVGKAGPQSYLMADDSGALSPPGYSVRAVDVPGDDDDRQQNVRQQPRKQQAQQNPERAAASKAFRDSLHFAHARSTELMRAPNSYAEWRERTLQRGRSSNGADLLLESEEGNSRNHSDGSGGNAPKHGVTKMPPTVRLPDRRPFIVEEALSPLPPIIHTPLRSITEVYHAAETRPAPQTSCSGPPRYAKASTIRQPRADERDAILQSSDEGEYSVSAANPSGGITVKKTVAPPPLPRPISAEMRDRLIHCADSIRGFGPRKLTEQEIARWRQLIRGDAQLQQLLIEARSVEELKTLCEMPDYRLHFTRMKWSQIMECVGEVTLAPCGTPKKEPPPSYAAAAASQLNLKLNLFKSFGSSATSSPSAVTGRPLHLRDRIHPIRDQAIQPETHRADMSQHRQERMAQKRPNPALGGASTVDPSAPSPLRVQTGGDGEAEPMRTRTRW